MIDANGNAQIAQNIEDLETVTNEKDLQSQASRKRKATKTTKANAKTAKTSVKTTQKIPANQQNAIATTTLDLDAGSLFLKSCIDGYLVPTIQSIYKEVKGDLPVGKAGTFTYKGRNFYVGGGCHSVFGELVEGYNDNKIKKLDVWLLGCLTSDTDFLDELIANDSKNKYKNKPIRLNVKLRLLSLSSNRPGDIAKILSSIDKFTYRNREFEVKITNLDDEFLYSEGYGAALTAKQLLSEDIREFSILDLGGGTLTWTFYRVGRHDPKVFEQLVSSGGGMQSISSRVFMSLNKIDLGGKEKDLDSLFAALRNSIPIKTEDEKFNVPFRLGNQTVNINDAVLDGLGNWVSQNPTIANIMTKVSQYLIGGGHVFCTGGGFASPIIANWIKAYVCNDIDNPNFQVLENPSLINLTGMKLLDKSK